MQSESVVPTVSDLGKGLKVALKSSKQRVLMGSVATIGVAIGGGLGLLPIVASGIVGGHLMNALNNTFKKEDRK